MKLAGLAGAGLLAAATCTGLAQGPVLVSSRGPSQLQPQAQRQSGSTPVLSTQDSTQVKHGGKCDVDAIPNRKVGCNLGFVNWYTLERQVSIGRSVAQQIESQVKFVNDPVITEYVNRIGQNLARNSDAQVPFTIKVIDSDVVNALSLPGGFLHVNSGLIVAADEEAELAV